MGTIKIQCVFKENEGEEVKKEVECKSFEVTKEKELGREQKKGACEGKKCWFEEQNLQLWQPTDKILPPCGTMAVVKFRAIQGDFYFKTQMRL
jgi:hypothetical protein